MLSLATLRTKIYCTLRQVRQSASILPKTGLCANTLVGLISVKYTSETDTLLAKNRSRIGATTSSSSALTTGVMSADSNSLITKPHAEIGVEQLMTTIRDYIEALKSYHDDT